MTDPIPFPSRRRPAPPLVFDDDLDPRWRGSRALGDIIQERMRIANLGHPPTPPEKLETRDDLIRAATMLVLRIEAMDQRAADEGRR